jgi:rfaE bifunctional protein nucleotidyltransferase chain/domain
MLTPKVWGYEDEIVNAEYCGKRMFIRPQYRCSVHHHKVKDEVLMVGNPDGVLWFEIGPSPDEMNGIFMQHNERIRVYPDQWHRFTALRETHIFEFSTHDEPGDSYRSTKSGKVEAGEFGALLSRFFAEESGDAVVGVDAAKVIADCLHEDGRIIGMCNGCFDLMHLGHVSLLESARQHCDVLFVVVNTDDSVVSLKGEERPFVGESGRAGMVASNRFVDYVILSDDTNHVKIVDAILPDVYVTTTECKDKSPEARRVKALGGSVEVSEMAPGYNTTAISREVVRKCGS